MSKQIDITDASVNIFLEIEGVVYAVAYERDKLEAISNIVKNGAANVIKTNKTQAQLTKFIGIGG